MITVNVRNTDATDDLFASGADNNLAPPAQLTIGRINAGQSVQIQVQEDGTGLCNVTVVVTRVDDVTRAKTFPNQSVSNAQYIEVDLFGT